MVSYHLQAGASDGVRRPGVSFTRLPGCPLVSLFSLASVLLASCATCVRWLFGRASHQMILLVAVVVVRHQRCVRLLSRPAAGDDFPGHQKSVLTQQYSDRRLPTDMTGEGSGRIMDATRSSDVRNALPLSPLLPIGCRLFPCPSVLAPRFICSGQQLAWSAFNFRHPHTVWISGAAASRDPSRQRQQSGSKTAEWQADSARRVTCRSTSPIGSSSCRVSRNGSSAAAAPSRIS